MSNFNAMSFKFSEKFDHPFSHVYIFGNMFPESPDFVAIPIRICIKDTCSNLVKGDEIVRPFDHHSDETVTLRKYVTKYKNMRKWMVEFL